MAGPDTARLCVLGEIVPAEIYEIQDEREDDAYLVGGAVRNVLIGRPVDDMDFIVFGEALEWAESLAVKSGGKFVLLDPVRSVGRVVLPGLTVDFAGAGCSRLDDELRHHDFTINTLAISLEELRRGSYSLLDPLGGLDDLAGGRLVAAGPSSLEDDPIRILRAFRFCAELGFSIDPTTRQPIRSAVHLLPTVASERIKYELWRIAAMPGSSSIMVQLDDVGALLAIFPECVPMDGTEQVGVAKIDVWRHALATYREVECLIDDIGASPFAGLAEEVDAYLSMPGNREILKLAALLHDVAKPQTRAYDDEGYTHFYGHDRLGGECVRQIARERLRLSTRERDGLELLVRRHMHPHLLGREESPTDRALRRFLRIAGADWIGLVLLAYADALASGPDEEGGTGDAIVHLASRLAALRKADAAREEEPRLMSGHDLIKVFGLKPGPFVGAILRQIEELRLEGKLNTRQEALDAARRLIGRGASPPSSRAELESQQIPEQQADEESNGDAR